MKSGNGEEFQDRKLNYCVVCGTSKLLGVRTQGNGKSYFLCKEHAELHDKLQGEERKLLAKCRRIVKPV
jgi:hypothetical protein